MIRLRGVLEFAVMYSVNRDWRILGVTVGGFPED